MVDGLTHKCKGMTAAQLRATLRVHAAAHVDKVACWPTLEVIMQRVDPACIVAIRDANRRLRGNINVWPQNWFKGAPWALLEPNQRQRPDADALTPHSQRLFVQRVLNDIIRLVNEKLKLQEDAEDMRTDRIASIVQHITSKKFFSYDRRRETCELARKYWTQFKLNFNLD